jgi:hypothetical protein
MASKKKEEKLSAWLRRDARDAEKNRIALLKEARSLLAQANRRDTDREDREMMIAKVHALLRDATQADGYEQGLLNASTDCAERGQ